MCYPSDSVVVSRTLTRWEVGCFQLAYFCGALTTVLHALVVRSVFIAEEDPMLRMDQGFA